MIEASTSGTGEPQYKIENGERKVLRWKKNERMGGMVPVWEKAPDTAKQNVQDALTHAATGKKENSFDQALAYADQNTHGSYEPEEFGFGDLIDMVNPLQHIPLVGHLYREITGDEIRPIAQIIGGGVFGGPAGLASGLINTVVEYETGHDIAGNVINMAATGKAPEYRSAAATQKTEQNLEAAAEIAQNGGVADLPGTAIGFADLGQRNTNKSYKHAPVADGRTAGTMVREHHATPRTFLPPREPITELILNSSPQLEREDT